MFLKTGRAFAPTIPLKTAELQTKGGGNLLGAGDLYV